MQNPTLVSSQDLGPLLIPTKPYCYLKAHTEQILGHSVVILHVYIPLLPPDL